MAVKKRLIRCCSFLLAAVLITAAAAAGGMRGLVVRAANAPTFWIETSTSSVKTGDSIVVKFFLTNNDVSSVMSFNGKITFNQNYFKYDTHSCPARMNGKVLCYDDEDVTSSSVGFSYADSTGMLIKGGDKNVEFFSVTLTVVNARAGTENISAAISMCTVGDDKLDKILVQPVTVSIGVTVPPTTTTTTTARTTQTVTTSPTLALSSENRLKQLAVAPGALSPAFSSDFYGYNVEVVNEISTIRIDAQTMSDKAIIVGGATVNKDLSVGYNYFTVTVRAENGDERSYSVIVRRLEPNVTETAPTDMSQVVIVSTSDPITQPSTEPSVTTITTANGSGTTIKVSDGGIFENDAMKIVGIIAAVIALFVFSFVSGYLVDQSMKEKRAAERIIKEREKASGQDGAAQDDFASALPQASQMQASQMQASAMQPVIMAQLTPQQQAYLQAQMQASQMQASQMQASPMQEPQYGAEYEQQGFDPYDMQYADYSENYDTFAGQEPIQLPPPEDDYYN